MPNRALGDAKAPHSLLRAWCQRLQQHCQALAAA